MKNVKVNCLYLTKKKFFFYLIDEINFIRSDMEIWADFSSIDFHHYHKETDISSSALKCKIERLDFEQTILILERKELSNLDKPKTLLKILVGEKIGWIYHSNADVGLKRLTKTGTKS